MTFDEGGDHSMTEADYMGQNDEVGRVSMTFERDRSRGRFKVTPVPAAIARKGKLPGIVYRPGSDESAKMLIEHLAGLRPTSQKWIWETKQRRGTYEANPYSLEATFVGLRHTIRLPGQRGTVLTWLKEKRESNG